MWRGWETSSALTATTGVLPGTPQGPRPGSLKGAAVLHPLPCEGPPPLGHSLPCLVSGDLPSRADIVTLVSTPATQGLGGQGPWACAHGAGGGLGREGRRLSLMPLLASPLGPLQPSRRVEVGSARPRGASPSDGEKHECPRMAGSQGATGDRAPQVPRAGPSGEGPAAPKSGGEEKLRQGHRAGGEAIAPRPARARRRARGGRTAGAQQRGAQGPARCPRSGQRAPDHPTAVQRRLQFKVG